MKGDVKGMLKALSFVLIALSFMLITACSKNSEEPESGLLVIGMLPEQQIANVRMNWIDAFLHQNKELEVEYVSVIDISHVNYREPGEIDGPEKVAELLGGPNPPDIVALGYDDFQEAIAQNLLAPLEPMMQGSSLTTDRLELSVLEHFRGPDAQLYGLAPVIRSSALVYNKDLFDQAQISYPADGMTWTELFELAERMTLDDSEYKIHGFTFGDRYEQPSLEDLLEWYGAGSGLTLYEGRQMSVNNREWRDVFDRFFRMMTDGIFPAEESESTFQDNPFYSGDVAMALMRDRELYEWMQLQENAATEEGFVPFQWDIVTVPVHEHARDQGAGIIFEPIFAISASAASPRTAWKLMEFMHSDQWVTMSMNQNQLLTFSHAGESLGVNYNRNALFQLRPVEQPIIQSGFFSRNTHYRDVLMSGRALYSFMTMNAISVEEMFQNWEEEGNRLLQEK